VRGPLAPPAAPLASAVSGQPSAASGQPQRPGQVIFALCRRPRPCDVACSAQPSAASGQPSAASGQRLLLPASASAPDVPPPPLL